MDIITDSAMANLFFALKLVSQFALMGYRLSYLISSNL